MLLRFNAQSAVAIVLGRAEAQAHHHSSKALWTIRRYRMHQHKDFEQNRVNGKKVMPLSAAQRRAQAVFDAVASMQPTCGPVQS